MDKLSVMRLVWSDQAEQDIREIIDYLELKSGETIMRKVIRKIYSDAQILVSNPRLGQRELLLEENPKGYRRLITGNYKILYRFEGDVVYVSTIFDCRRDPVVLGEILELV